MKPTFKEEERLWELGYSCVAGIDEVGRGPLAGPVVAGAVILHRGSKACWLPDVRDSKTLSARRREYLAGLIQQEAMAVGIGMVPANVIDFRGIAAATRQAMDLAVKELICSADFLLIDAVALPESNIPQKSIVRGDSLCLSIAAASIVAKVFRDRLMLQWAEIYPGYGFEANKGYPTPEHLAALRRLGSCPIHRRTFGPVREVLVAHGC